MNKWAQWLINNNIRWVVYIVYVLVIIPNAIFHIITDLMPGISREIKQDFLNITKAKKIKKEKP